MGAKEPKRPKQIHSLGVRTGNPDQDLTPEQFQLIGRVAISYNEAENLFNAALSSSLGLDVEISDDVTSRVNGLEGAAEIINRQLSLLAPNYREELVGTVTAFKELKGHRDAIIHSRPFHTEYGLGESPPKKGKRSETRMSAEYLRGVYGLSEVLRKELVYFTLILGLFALMKVLFRYVPMHARPDGVKTEALLGVYLAQYRSLRQDRQSLKPLPEFPVIPPDRHGENWKEAVAELRKTIEKQMSEQPAPKEKSEGGK
jgi:hypothetical protein